MRDFRDSASLAHASAINLSSRVLAVCLGLALTLYTARLGPQAQGVFAVFLAVEAVLLAAGSGFGVALARRLSHHQQHPGPWVRQMLLASMALGVALALALAWASRTAGESYASLAWLAWAAPLMLLPGNLSGLWLGRGHMLGLAAFMLAPPALTLLGIAVVHALGMASGVAAVLTAWVVARVAVALGSLAAAARSGYLKAQPHARTAQGLQTQAGFIAIIGLTNLVSLLNYKVDVFLVERFMGLAPTGVYSIAVAVAELLWLVSSAVTTAAYARIGQPDRAAAVELTLKAMHASVGMLMAISPLLLGAAWWLVPALLGEAYRSALPALALLLPGVVLYGAASALSAWFTNHAGRPQVPALLALCSLLINIAVSLWAIPRWGLLGAALATTLSYAITMAVAVWVFSRASGCPLRRALWPWGGPKTALQ